MIKGKKSKFASRYQASYESKDKGGFSKASVMDWKKVDEVNFYQPVAGKNRINIIPYVIKSKNHPLVRRGEMEVGDLDYVMDVWVHRSVGPTEGSILCLKNTFGKPCPICEQMAMLKKQGKEDEAKDLRASRRVFYNVQDLKEPDKLKVFETSHYLFEKELIDEARDDDEGGFIDFASLEDGKEIRFRGAETSLGTNKYLEFKSFSFSDRDEEIDEELVEKAISFDDIMNVPTYEEAQKLLFGDDDDDDVPSKSSKKSYDEDDEDEDEPPKKSKKHVDDEEEEDDEDEPPKKSKKRVEDDEPPFNVDDSNSKSKCKFGHRFGKDCDTFDECDDCDLWDKCCKAR